jgi:hypothetical protein
MKKSLFYLIMLFTFALNGNVLAQEQQVTGTIISADDNLPLPGVNVRIKGTSRGAITDVDGQFSIQASSDEVLTFSFVGFADQERVVGNSTVIDITLKLDTSILGEVVVTGYKTNVIKLV